MKFTFEVGKTEKHLIEYNFNQLLGRLEIKVNQQSIKQSTRLFSEPVREAHEFDVGKQEHWSIRIEKERKHLFGQINRVFINNRLASFYQGV